VADATWRRHAGAGGAAPERVTAWAAQRFQEACARATSASAAEVVRPDPIEAEKLAEEIAHAIGDVELQLPGERLGLDPLLRREAPGE
jgi:hypothetical protein